MSIPNPSFLGVSINGVYDRVARPLQTPHSHVPVIMVSLFSILNIDKIDIDFTAKLPNGTTQHIGIYGLKVSTIPLASEYPPVYIPGIALVSDGATITSVKNNVMMLVMPGGGGFDLYISRSPGIVITGTINVKAYYC